MVLEDLVESIQASGLLNPIIIRPVEDKYEIIAGNRRYYACKRLKWTRIPCHIVDVTDKEAYELALTENIQHQTLSPLEIANSFRKYVENFGYGGVSELARNIGKSEQYVSEYLQLLKLPDDILKKLSTRVVTLSQVRSLTCLKPYDQRLLIDAIEREQLTSRQVEEIAADLKNVDIRRKTIETLSYSSFAGEELRNRKVERSISKCIASLKMTMIRFDRAIEETDDNEWILRETLLEHRRTLHNQIDGLIRLRKKIKQMVPP